MRYMLTAELLGKCKCRKHQNGDEDVIQAHDGLIDYDSPVWQEAILCQIIKMQPNQWVMLQEL